MSAKKPTPPPVQGPWDEAKYGPRLISPPPPPKNGEFIRGSVPVWDIGSKVLVGTDVPAIVLQVLIEGNSTDKLVQYKVAWWDGRNRHEEWVHASEVSGTESAGVRYIGFSSRG